MRQAAPVLPANSVLLTVPFAVSGSAQPMLWQAAGGYHFRLAGAAVKTPNALGGPVGSGSPGSARRILTDLTLLGGPEPTATPAEIATLRRALREWQVDDVVIDGHSRDPCTPPGSSRGRSAPRRPTSAGAWVWRLQPGGPTAAAATGAPLTQRRGYAAAPGTRTDPLAMSRCVLFGAGRS